MAPRLQLDMTYIGWFSTTDVNLCNVLCSSAEDKTVPANGKALIDTQLSIAVPVGTYGRVAPRSGLGG